ncbi:MAG TPA: sortase [Chloroflexota bacterium]|nr:sortase [Chloroflexota bacterium]
MVDVDALIGYLRAHRGARRGLSALSVVLALVAVGLLAYPLLTNVYENWLQGKLSRQLESSELADRYRSRSLRDGDALTRIRIGKLGVETTVVHGISRSALRAGAGHYPRSPLPCEDGNVAIAGHRTTYGKPFADIDRLQVGDAIVLDTPVGSCTYQVAAAPLVTHPNDWGVVANTPGQRTLTLTTCHPKGSARQRLVVHARLVGSPVARA